MRKNKETIMLAKIRRLIRDAIRWHKIDNGMPTHWSTKNYQRAKKMKGLVLKKSEQHYVYYTRSSKAIEDIAKKILKVINNGIRN